MFRRGAQRLQGLLRQHADEITAASERAASGYLAGPSSASGSVGCTTVQRVVGAGTKAFHSSAGPIKPGEPYFPYLLKPENRLMAFLKRAFNAEGPKRGFENFTPKSFGNGAKTATKAAEKPSQAGSGGGGGGGGGSSGGSGGGKKGDGSKMLFEVSLPMNLLFLAGSGAYLWYLFSQNFSGGGAGGRTHEITFQDFRSRLLAQGMVTRVEVANNNLAKVYVRPEGVGGDLRETNGIFKYYFQIGSVESFERKLDEAQRELGLPPQAHVPVKYVSEVSILAGVFELLPTILLMGATYWIISRQMRQMTGGMPGMGSGKGKAGGGPGSFFGMGRATTTSLDKTAADQITFKDVAGCDEAKQEIMEFVDFLKHPQKYKDLGAKIPKGALLVGPPGTGKTLLAKATAGEANVPFLSISGSDFMEMFVGVGPARVRDLFAQARSQSPSMIFIDEIDAIGRARGRGGAMGGHDERENTLNQLLVEMDGFATTTGVIVLAGTNRPDILDKALLRPGRFDRTISVDIPDIKGRVQICRVHLSKLRLTKEIDFYAERLAALTPGMSGADIANVCNEAALVAARSNKHTIDMVDFEQAIDRVIGGLEKKNKVISAVERKTVAFHESGHAVVSWFLEHAEPLLKVSIVPRGASVLGFAQYLPNENLLMTKEQLLDRVCAVMGGRAAEQVLLGKISTGATNDLERVTQMAYSQVAVYGMNDKIGQLSYRMDREAFDKPYSEETARIIDNEVRAFVDMAYKKTVAIVEERKDLITNMALELLKREVLNHEDVERVLGARPFMSPEMRNIDRYLHGQGEPASSDVPSTSDGGPSTPEVAAGSGGGGDRPRGDGPGNGGGGSGGSGGGGTGTAKKGGPRKPGGNLAELPEVPLYRRRVEPGVTVATCEGGKVIEGKPEHSEQHKEGGQHTEA